MLQLRAFGEPPTMDVLLRRLAALDGARHITRSGDGNGGHRVVVTADVDPVAADTALATALALGVAPVDVALLRLDAIQPGQDIASDVVWADMLGLAGQYAALRARVLLFMAIAGIIAGYGVIFANGILIVGAMALSPDLLPVAATCIGIVLGRRSLVRRAFCTLVAGLCLAGVVAGVLTASLI